MGKDIIVSKQKNKDNLSLPAFSISNKNGFVPQEEQFGKDNTYSKTDKSSNYIVKPMYFAYNPARINVGSIAYQNTITPVLVSSLYEIFRSNNNIDDVFLQYWFRSEYFYKQIQRLQEGGVRQYFFIDKMRESRIYLTNVSEQNKIGSLISKLDKLITLQQRKLELLKVIKKAEIQQISKQKLIVKGKINNKYVSINIGKTFKITRGNVLAKENISPCKTNSNPYPVYSSQTKNDGLLGYFDRYLFENAITWTTDGANAGTVKFRSGKFFSTNVSGVLISNTGYANEINAEILNSVTYKYVSHVGNPKLMNNVMKDINITIPSTTLLQNKFSDFILTLKISISKQEEKIQNYKHLKHFLLQNMFI